MNLDRIFDFYAKSTDTKVAYKEWRAAEREVDSFMEVLGENAGTAISAEVLQEALGLIRKAQHAQMEAVAALLTQDRPQL